MLGGRDHEYQYYWAGAGGDDDLGLHLRFLVMILMMLVSFSWYLKMESLLEQLKLVLIFSTLLLVFVFRNFLSNSTHQTQDSMQTPWGKIMANKGEGDSREPINEQAVANIYGALRTELNQIYSKITELEMEVSEHSLVINAIQPLDQSRRCYRMIGGVLVERTIKEVLPAVQRNKEGLEEVIARLNDALERKKKEITELEAKYKIRVGKSDSAVKDDGSRKEGSAQGVLVGPAGGSE